MRNFSRARSPDLNSLCAPSCLAEQFDVVMPSSPFAAKLWIPRADAESAAALRRGGVYRSQMRRREAGGSRRARSSGIGSADGTHLFLVRHVARYAAVFAPRYPIFDNYIRNFRYFINDSGYRMAMMPLALQKTFFLRSSPNAWIPATSFHVDCGGPGELTFYANGTDRDADRGRRRISIHRPMPMSPTGARHRRRGACCQARSRMHARLVDDFLAAPRCSHATRSSISRPTICAARWDASCNMMRRFQTWRKRRSTRHSTLSIARLPKASAVPLPQAV